MTVIVAIIALALPNGEGDRAAGTDYKPRHRGCNTRACDHRVDKKVRRRVRARKATVIRPYDAKLNRIAMCESRMRWYINTGNGFYGGLQFTAQTWWSVGGRGLPHYNPPLEQKFRAVKVYRRRGNWGDWPVCGYR